MISKASVKTAVNAGEIQGRVIIFPESWKEKLDEHSELCAEICKTHNLDAVVVDCRGEAQLLLPMVNSVVKEITYPSAEKANAGRQVSVSIKKTLKVKFPKDSIIANRAYGYVDDADRIAAGIDDKLRARVWVNDYWRAAYIVGVPIGQQHQCFFTMSSIRDITWDGDTENPEYNELFNAFFGPDNGNTDDTSEN